MTIPAELILHYAFLDSNPALLEGLEIDQYLWGIIQSISGAACDTVTIDSSANWRPLTSVQASNSNCVLPGPENGIFCICSDILLVMG